VKVIGLGAPDSVRVRFDGCELDVLIDVLRDQRSDATHEAAETYATTPEQRQAVDDRHDRLRAVEALLMQLEEQLHTRRGAVLIDETERMGDAVRAGARETLRRLAETHARYAERASPESRDALLDAAKTATARVATLTGADRVDRGWQA
jgi:hypothetical protein